MQTKISNQKAAQQRQQQQKDSSRANAAQVPRTIRTMVACRQKARQGKRRRCHHSVHYCRTYCTSPPSLDRPAAALTVIILMTTVIVLFLSPLCARRCKSTSELTRSPFLPLSRFPSLSFVLVCKQMHVLAKTPGQDRSKKRAKGAAVKPPTRQAQHPQESISPNHQR